jgi:hypothetical protein
VSASGQNVFFAEFLDALGSGLEDAGLDVERSVDRFPPWREDDVFLFVPHEYLPLVHEEAHPAEAHLRRSVVLSTEQPGTSWFELASSVAERAAAVVDINALGVRELKHRGIDARRLPLGYVSAWDTWGGADDAERPIDVTFMGGYAERRGQALAQCAPVLAGRRVDLRLTETTRPHLEDSADFLSGERRWAALRRAKLIVNIHRSELGYLEWHRVIGAMLNGCLVVTEHSLGFEPMAPGEQFVSVGYHRIPVAVDVLLSHPQRVAEMREAAYQFLRDELPLSRTIGSLMEAIDEVASKPHRRVTAIPLPTAPLPLEPQLPATEYERIFAHQTDNDRMRAGIKDLLLGQLEVRRQLAALGAEQREPTDAVEHFGPRDREIRVSVLLTVYNYEEVVRKAIASVAGSPFEGYELVAVDDGSSDNSLAAIREELECHPTMTATVVSRGRNQGLAAARNCAVEHARGDLVFILDADNQVYPHALGRLASTLDEAPSARFAYGIIEQFGARGSIGLMSWQTWDPDRLRYGNYIDAMAMIRRSALLEVGGYTRDRRLHGWEDFDLWCAFAERGWHGVHVREILCRYRTETYSMISTTNIDGQAAWSALVQRHAFLSANRPHAVAGA